MILAPEDFLLRDFKINKYGEFNFVGIFTVTFITQEVSV